MTVVTTVFPASRPWPARARASTARIWSPSITAPSALTARHRSASPSCAMPASAPCLVTSARSTSRWVDPQPSLMFSPSGSAPIAITLAPACCSICGANSAAAPCAQSTTTVSPASGAPGSPSWPATAGTDAGSEDSRCRVYRSRSAPASLTRPNPAGSSLARRGGMPMCASISSSTASGSLKPPWPNSLIPLSGAGLWLADSITPSSAPRSRVRNATAGVGITPSRSTSTPDPARPATTAASRNSPEARGSRPTTASGRRPAASLAWNAPQSCSTVAAARDTSSASWLVRSSPATPRTPSVPNSRAITRQLPRDQLANADMPNRPLAGE